MNTMELKGIENHYETARNMAFNLIKNEASKILHENNDLYEFVMGMGTAFFIYNSGNHVIDDHIRFKEFFNVLYDFDGYYNFCITGNPIRLRKDAVDKDVILEITDW